MNPELVTRLLHESVPVLEHLQWRVVEVQEGFAKAVLPLTLASTNQHGTHQAALIFMAADYTGAVALATVFRGVPLVGIHRLTGTPPVAGWLLKGSIEYKAPSAGDLVITCRVPQDRFESLRRELADGTRVIESLRVELSTDGEITATADMVYFVRQSQFLRPQLPGDRIGTLHRHQLKASARLIAGLRAAEQNRPEPLFLDPYSGPAAASHGALLARSLSQALPALPEMVAARTRHIDDRLTESLDAGVEQVVFVGVGLDFRPFRLITGRKAKVFEVDLDEMLAERERVLRQLGSLPPANRYAIPLNLLFGDLAETLLAHAEFDAARPTFLVFEGASMYFAEHINARLFSSMRRLLCNPQSRLWTDVVAPSVVAGATGDPEVAGFVNGMSKLGEPFVFGVDDPATYFPRLGLEPVSIDPSDFCGRSSPDPVYKLYRFVLLRSAGSDARSENA